MERSMEVINLKKEKIKLLTKQQQELYENAKVYYVCEEKFQNKYMKNKKYQEVKDHCQYAGEYRGTVHSICNLKDSVPQKNSYSFL